MGAIVFEPDEIVVSGRQGGGRYEEAVPLSVVDGTGIASTWARSKVRGLEQQQLWGDVEEVEDDLPDASSRRLKHGHAAGGRGDRRQLSTHKIAKRACAAAPPRRR